MTTKKQEAGSVNMRNVTESIKSIEFLTQQYKRKRMSTESYIKLVHESLSKLTNERDYKEYLKSIGQW